MQDMVAAELLAGLKTAGVQGSYGYVIVAKAGKRDPITIKSKSCRFIRLQNGWEVGEFRYQPHQSKRRHRYVVVRRPFSEDPIEAGQRPRCKDIKSAYHLFVTN